MLRCEFLWLPFKWSVLLFPLVDVDFIRQMLSDFLPHLSRQLIHQCWSDSCLFSCKLRSSFGKLRFALQGTKSSTFSTEVPQPHFGGCVFECFTPASRGPGDLRLHVDTASLSLETGQKQVVQLASREHVYLSAQRQDGTALEGGGNCTAPFNCVQAIRQFHRTHFQIQKGECGYFHRPPLTQLGEESPFFSIYYTYSVFWMLLSVFHNQAAQRANAPFGVICCPA